MSEHDFADNAVNTEVAKAGHHRGVVVRNFKFESRNVQECVISSKAVPTPTNKFADVVTPAASSIHWYEHCSSS